MEPQWLPTRSFRSATGSMSLLNSASKAVIQPGGSRRDDGSNHSANDTGMAMVFTGIEAFSALMCRGYAGQTGRLAHW